MTRTLQLAAPVAGAFAALPGGLADSQANDFALMEKIANAMEPALVDESVTGSGLSVGEGAALRALRHQLLTLDPEGHFAGLRRVLTPAGEYMWVCPEHRVDYDPGLPIIARPE